jgi:hypothetical protein
VKAPKQKIEETQHRFTTPGAPQEAAATRGRLPPPKKNLCDWEEILGLSRRQQFRFRAGIKGFEVGRESTALSSQIVDKMDLKKL